MIRARENQSSRDSAASAIGPRLSRKEGRKRCNNPINNPKTKKVLFKFYPIYVFIYTQDLIHHCILNYAYVTMASLGIFKSNIRQYRKFICRILQLPIKKYFEIIRATEIHDDSLCMPKYRCSIAHQIFEISQLGNLRIVSTNPAFSSNSEIASFQIWFISCWWPPSVLFITHEMLMENSSWTSQLTWNSTKFQSAIRVRRGFKAHEKRLPPPCLLIP